MLRPLGDDKLSALLRPHDTADAWQVSNAKLELERYRELMGGILALFRIWPSTFNVYFRYDKKDSEKWYILFVDSPLRSLYLRPGSETSICIYAFGKHVKTFEILDHPQNWVAMLKWVWNYGHERQVAKVKSGSMFPLLDLETYTAIADKNGKAGPSMVRQANECFANKDVAEGVYMLLMAFQLASPQLHREALNPATWHICFKKSPLTTLRIQPDDDPRGIAIYAYDERIKSLKVIDCPPRQPFVGDLEGRQRMIEFIWDYGNKRMEERLKYEAEKPRSKPKTKTKRTEELHKVLHTAAFKARHGKVSKGKTVKPSVQQEDDIMEDIEAVCVDTHFEQSSSRQFFSQQSPLRASDPNARLGTMSKTNDTINDQVVKFRAGSPNIEGLNIRDHQD